MDDLWDDDGITPEEEGNKNPYLTDPVKGMELIARLLPRKMRDRREYTLRRLDYMIDSQLMATVQSLELRDAIGQSQRLEKISDQISEYQKIRLLQGKSIVGIGGQFSAGKSRFINSLLSSEMVLPEARDPTTAIPTYVAEGDAKEDIFAYCGGRREPLDREALQAITHAFYEEYGIGFSRYIQNIVVHATDFPKKWRGRVVFLDTPGYNKPDMDARETLTDERLAASQLKAVDYLIWLVDIENGVVQERDIDFMRSLNVKTPILVVFNKADKKDEENCQSIVDESRNVLSESGIDVFGVAAYSALRREELLGTNLVDEFLLEAANFAAEKKDEEKILKGTIKSIQEKFQEAKAEEWKRQRELAEDIRSVREDIRAIRSLVDMYGRSVHRRKRLFSDGKRFDSIAQTIRKDFQALTGTSKNDCFGIPRPAGAGDSKGKSPKM